MIVIYGCTWLAALASAAPPPAAPAAAPAKATPPAKATKTAKAGHPKPSASARVPSEAEKKRIIQRVQRYYRGLEDYSADFIQIYTRVALSKTTESRGKLTLKKPNRMRWAYEKPAEKLWVVNGDKLVVADPEEMQVFVEEAYQSEEMANSIRFLWGRGKLTDTFKAALRDPEAFGAKKKGVAALELTPKKGASFTRLVLLVDKKTGAVQESIVFETAGNTNHFKFRSPKLNQKVPDRLFTFIPPEGWEIIKR